jgi:hypothetical protein
MPLTLFARFAWVHDWTSPPSLNAAFQTLPGASFHRQWRGASDGLRARLGRRGVANRPQLDARGQIRARTRIALPDLLRHRHSARDLVKLRKKCRGAWAKPFAARSPFGPILPTCAAQEISSYLSETGCDAGRPHPYLVHDQAENIGRIMRLVLANEPPSALQNLTTDVCALVLVDRR